MSEGSGDTNWYCAFFLCFRRGGGRFLRLFHDILSCRMLVFIPHVLVLFANCDKIIRWIGLWLEIVMTLVSVCSCIWFLVLIHVLFFYVLLCSVFWFFLVSCLMFYVCSLFLIHAPVHALLSRFVFPFTPTRQNDWTWNGPTRQCCNL